MDIFEGLKGVTLSIVFVGDKVKLSSVFAPPAAE